MLLMRFENDKNKWIRKDLKILTKNKTLIYVIREFNFDLHANLFIEPITKRISIG